MIYCVFNIFFNVICYKYVLGIVVKEIENGNFLSVKFWDCKF